MRQCRTEPRTTLPLCAAAREASFPPKRTSNLRAWNTSYRRSLRIQPERGLFPKGSYYRMSDLRWLCEVVHTWGQNTRGTLPVRGLTIGGDHVRRTRGAVLRFLQA